MPDHIPTISVKSLREMLSGYPDDFEISFSGLEFYRLKTRGEKLVQMEFNEHVSRSKTTGKVTVANPE
jgi:hypothetical protein